MRIGEMLVDSSSLGLLVLLLVVAPDAAAASPSRPRRRRRSPACRRPRAHRHCRRPARPARARARSPGTDSMIDIGQVEGRVAASGLRKVGEIVEKHPDEAVAIVRSWMYQDS